MEKNPIDYKGFPYKKHFKIVDEELEHKIVYSDITEEIEISKDGNFFTLEKEYVGYPSFKCKGKGKIVVNFGERKIETVPENYAKAWWDPIINYFTIDSEDFTEIKIEQRRACKFIKITLLEGNVVVKDFKYDSVNAKIDKEGYFKCSDEKLNKIYDICKHTTKLCMQDYFEDGVKRDGLLWLGDARVQFLCNYALFAKNDLVKKSIKYFTMSIDKKGRANVNAMPAGAYIHPSKIEYMFGMKNEDGTYCEEYPRNFYLTGLGYYLNYAVDYFAILYEYYKNTGDLEFVKEIFPFAKKVVDRVCRVDGVNTYGNFIVRAVRAVRKVIWRIKGKNVDNLHGKLFPRMTQKRSEYVDGLIDNGSYFAYLTNGLKNHLEICKILGDKEEELKTLRYISKFTKATKKYMDEAGFVVRKVSGDKEAVCTFTGLTSAHLAGIIDGETFKKNFKALLSGERKSAYPMNGMAKFWIIKSAFEADYQLAIDFIRKEWGVLIDRGYSTCVENWISEFIEDAEEDINLSMCHGWSAGPCVTLMDLLGIIPVEDGYKKIKIQPRLCDLDFVEGALPTEFGLIKVYADKNGFKYELPEGVTIVE